MTNSGLAAPPRPAPRRAVRRDTHEAPPPPPPPPKRHSQRTTYGWAFTASITAHLLLLLLSPLFIQTENPPGGAPAPSAVQSPWTFGMEMVIAIPSDDAPEFPEPATTDLARPPVAPPSTVLPPATTGGVTAGTGEPTAGTPSTTTPADAAGGGRGFGAGSRDPRLYVRPNPLPPPDNRTEHERYLDHFQARIDAVNDSMGIAAARNATTADWTVTDGSGNRWGLSPDGLHLGGVTIPREILPLPGPTGDNASREAERERQRQRDEIIRQEADRERRETQQERIDATRQGATGTSQD